MSENKRQLARTQGRFNNGNEASKIKKSNSSTSSRSGQGRRSGSGEVLESSDRPCQGSNNFQSLDKIPVVLELSTPGKTTLSDTENGESSIFFDPGFIPAKEADDLYRLLLKNVDWGSKKVVINGEEVPQPRLVAWFGPLPYTYSGLTLKPKDMPDEILKVKRDVEYVLKKNGMDVELNSVLLNLYRDEKDSVAWHSDDETSMGICPTIASVSLGETRRFQLRRKSEDKYANAEYVVHLDNGSLIVMDGVMQIDWQHRVPKEFHQRQKRINLTFRTVYPFDSARRPFASVFSLREMKAALPPSEPFRFMEEAFPTLGEGLDSEQEQKGTVKEKKSSNAAESKSSIGLEATYSENDWSRSTASKDDWGVRDCDIRCAVQTNDNNKHSNYLNKRDNDTSIINSMSQSYREMHEMYDREKNNNNVEELLLEEEERRHSSSPKQRNKRLPNYSREDKMSNENYNKIPPRNRRPTEGRREGQTTQYEGSRHEGWSSNEMHKGHESKYKNSGTTNHKNRSNVIFKGQKSQYKDYISTNHEEESFDQMPESQESQYKSSVTTNHKNRSSNVIPKGQKSQYKDYISTNHEEESFDQMPESRESQYKSSVTTNHKNRSSNVIPKGQKSQYKDPITTNHERESHNDIPERQKSQPKDSVNRNKKTVPSHRMHESEKSQHTACVTIDHKRGPSNEMHESDELSYEDSVAKSDKKVTSHEMHETEKPETSVTKNNKNESSNSKPNDQKPQLLNSVMSADAPEFHSKYSAPTTEYMSSEFDNNYRQECTNLQKIYDYIEIYRHEISFSKRDNEELKVLFTVIDFAKEPLPIQSLVAICRRLETIVYFAENRNQYPLRLSEQTQSFSQKQSFVYYNRNYR